LFYAYIPKVRVQKQFSSDTVAHLHGIMAHLYYRIQIIAEISAEQRAIRLKNAQDMAEGYLHLESSKLKPLFKTPSTIEVQQEESLKDEELNFTEEEKQIFESENWEVQRELESLAEKSR
jgi:hypothetical protein